MFQPLDIPEGNLKIILNNYHEGNTILNSYEINNKLDGLLRNKLCHIIITHIFKNNDKKITKEKFISLSKEICELFPSEKQATYYIPYKKEANLVSSAKGKLWDKYNNLRKEIRKTNPKLNQNISSLATYVPNEGIIRYFEFCIVLFC